MNALIEFLAGGLTLGYGVAGLVFFRFFARTRDRLFLLFGIAFALMALHRVLLLITGESDEAMGELYGVRLAAFAIILAAIIDKNLAPRRARRRTARALPRSAESPS